MHEGRIFFFFFYFSLKSHSSSNFMLSDCARSAQGCLVLGASRRGCLGLPRLSISFPLMGAGWGWGRPRVEKGKKEKNNRNTPPGNVIAQAWPSLSREGREGTSSCGCNVSTYVCTHVCIRVHTYLCIGACVCVYMCAHMCVLCRWV